VHPEGLEPPAI